MRNPCKECDYYHKENNTCQSKKCLGRGGDGTVTIWDGLFCEPDKHVKGADDYERATEQMEHDVLYEPTYNAEDGSM